jgi:hypothetical protein
MSDQQRVLSIAGFALFAVFVTGPASGALIPLVDADVTSANAHYATSQNANIAVTYNAADVGSQQGTLTLNTTWGAGDFATRSILFQQTELPLGDFGSTGGLRLQLEFSLGNNTGSLWDAFQVRIEDTSAPANVGVAVTGGEGSHLFKAHFHPNAGGIIVAGGLTTPAFNNVSLIELDSGTSGSLIMTNFFVHERNLTDADADEQAVFRNFTIFLTPHAFVPEPAPWALLAIGGLMLIMRGLRSRTT